MIRNFEMNYDTNLKFEIFVFSKTKLLWLFEKAADVLRRMFHRRCFAERVSFFRRRCFVEAFRRKCLRGRLLKRAFPWKFNKNLITKWLTLERNFLWLFLWSFPKFEFRTLPEFCQNFLTFHVWINLVTLQIWRPLQAYDTANFWLRKICTSDGSWWEISQFRSLSRF